MQFKGCYLFIRRVREMHRPFPTVHEFFSLFLSSLRTRPLSGARIPHVGYIVAIAYRHPQLHRPRSELCSICSMQCFARSEAGGLSSYRVGRHWRHTFSFRHLERRMPSVRGPANVAYCETRSVLLVGFPAAMVNNPKVNHTVQFLHNPSWTPSIYHVMKTQ